MSQSVREAFAQRNTLVLPRAVLGQLASEVTPERVTWVWPGRLAEGKITMLDGNPGLGKSTTALDIAARISTGAPFPGSPLSRTARGVVVMSAEDGEADTTVPRLIGAGANLRRIFLLHGAKNGDEEEDVLIPSGMDLIAQAIRDMQAQLLIIDPLFTYFDQKINANRDQDVKQALRPLKELLEREGCAALLLRHLTKGEAKDAMMRGQGSIGISGVSRFGLIAVKDPSDEEAVVIAPYKTNIGKAPPSMTYRFAAIPDTDVARVVWDDDPAQWSANELMEASSEGNEEEDVDEVCSWLQHQLRDGGVTRALITKEARKDGYSERRIRFAIKRLGVISKPSDFGGEWVMTLPRVTVHPGRIMETNGHIPWE